MDLEAYISSGILESYALGAATPKEKVEVEANIVAYPELAIELALIREAIESYALLHEQNPPADLKAKTMQALFGEQSEKPKANFTIEKSENQINNLFNWRVAASWALLALSVGGNFYFFSQWKSTEGKLVVAQAQNTQMAQNDVIQKANFETKIAIIDNAQFKKVVLKGTEAAPNAFASVYFNTISKEVYLVNMKMPVLPEGKQYQLWAIIDGKPVDAGMISEADSLGKMKLSPNAAAFAISIENVGGSTTAEGPKGAVLVSGAV
ncbi:MAG: anti-sigma factor [Bacteroidota bacterium]